MKTIIKQGEFNKKEASIYLVKNFEQNRNQYLLAYYFRSTKKDKGKLHENGIKKLYEHEINRIKLPTNEEIALLKNKILQKYPSFNFSTFSNNIDFSEERCIRILEQKGYKIHKQL
jgi:hypothetical protein